jgi:hypothetical protein
MFKFLQSNPIKKLRKVHAQLMTKAVDAQRNGQIALFGELSFEADEIYKKILELEKKKDES